MLPFLLTLPIPSVKTPPLPVERARAIGTSRAEPIGTGSKLSQARQAPQPTRPSRRHRGYPYISVQGGLAFSDALNGLDVTAMQSPTFRFNPGADVEVAVGYQFTNHTRLEVSASYLTAVPSSLSLSSQGQPMATVDAGGDLGLFTITMNGILEFPIRNRKGQIEPLTPYVGAGLGYGNLSVPHCAITASTCLRVRPVNTLAYQLKAGLSYRVNARTSMFLEGSYLGALGTTFSNESGAVLYDQVGAMRLNLGLRLGL